MSPGRTKPRRWPGDPEEAAAVIRSLLNHVNEMDTADLPVVDGHTVRLVSLSEVEQWLEGCATRAHYGVEL